MKKTLFISGVVAACAGLGYLIYRTTRPNLATYMAIINGTENELVLELTAKEALKRYGGKSGLTDEEVNFLKMCKEICS